jgi:hypothetical protein
MLEFRTPPKIIVIPAQSDSDALIAWLRNSMLTTDVTMSVCTEAFVLTKTGLLSGKAATTHHGAYKQLAMAFPDILVKRGTRIVESGNLASSGGLSCGIDFALHVVERCFGAVALSTANNLEYQGVETHYFCMERTIGCSIEAPSNFWELNSVGSVLPLPSPALCEKGGGRRRTRRRLPINA